MEGFTTKEITKNPERLAMRGFLESCGANFEEVESVRESLQKWTNKGNTDAMKKIFGEGKWRDFKEWASNWAKRYEIETGIKQGKVSGKYGSGEIRLLCLMTRYAAFDDASDTLFSKARFSEEVDVRRKNGELRDNGVDKSEYLELIRPDTKEEYKPGSFPPSYPEVLINELKSWEK